jgi:hypothetical protein
VGPRGLDGFIQFIKYFHFVHGVEAEYFEPAVERLVASIQGM